MLNLIYKYSSIIVLTFIVNLVCFAQKAKLPSKIGDGFVLEFVAPYNRITIDTNEKNLPNREFSEIFITPQTEFKNNKGKPAVPEAIRPGMKVEVRLDPKNFAQLTALQIKIRTNFENWEENVDGYLDRIEDEYAFVDGAKIVLPPNTALVGTDKWKGTIFTSLKNIPLGSLLNLKGIRQSNGTVLIKQGNVKPNTFTPLELQLVEKLKQGLTVPPPGKLGAGVKIGEQTYKVVEDLQVNAFINTLGNRIVPRYLRNLPPEDPNKIVFRFYVLEDETPNAVAFSDGSVFIHTGMLKRLENEAQVAIVLGHEIAHVTNEHVRRRMETAGDQALLAAIIGAAAGKALGQEAGESVTKLSYALLSNKFTNDMEDQADRVGLYYAYQAGYDVREAPQIWRRLMGNYNETTVGSILYADHPAMLARLRDMRREVVSNYANADFSEVITGRDKYVEGVGVYFGWIQPKPNTHIISTKIPSITAGKTITNKSSAAIPTAAGDGFATFYLNFKKVVLANKRTAIRNMMSSSFEWALDGYGSRDEALKNMNSMKLWIGLRSAVLRKPVVCKQPYCNNRAGYRVWSPGKYGVEIMFEKDIDGNWYWTALLGD